MTHHLRRLSTATAPSTAVTDSLLTRRLPLIRDWISPQPSHLLALTLSAYIPALAPRSRNHPTAAGSLRAGHHLVYFPPQLPESLLLPDGSDREQAPGDDGSHLVRRMWAGGSVAVNRRGDRGLRYLHPAVLDEAVDSAEPRGEKLFVWFTRRMFSLPAAAASWDASDEELRLRLSAAIPDVVERRCLVYLPARPAAAATPAAPPPKVVKPRSLPEFGYEFTPTQHLLLRFSALTFNAHRIHYDADFSTRVEGYPANLCHGPLALAFLLEMAGIEARGRGREVRRIEYRCLAPMFVDQRYKIAGRWREDGNAMEVWAETPEGGLSVRGLVEVE